MFRNRVLTVAAIVCSISAFAHANSPEKKVLLIGIDGCRFDALRAADTPHFDALIDTGAYDDETLIIGERFRDADTISGPGWSTILTGVWADKHRVLDNDFVKPDFTTYPHFFQRVKDALPGAHTASITDWEPINKFITTAADVSLSLPKGNFYIEGDLRVADEAVRLLSEADPTAAFVYFAQVDAAGHRNGFHPAMPGYRLAIEKVDAHIGRIVEAIRSRKTYADEDWLVLVTSDHGGKGLEHGGGHDDPEVNRSFLIVNGPSATHGKIEGQTYLVDVAPTVLAHLGVPLDPLWKLDGRPVGLKETPKTAIASRSAEMTLVTIGASALSTNVPDPWRQGIFLGPQCISAVDICPDSKSIALATLAFRHNQNFWLISDEGNVNSSRYVEPWAPFQAALLPGAKACAVGLTYSRVTDPAPTVSLFDPATPEEAVLVDADWDLGWLRYGQGDWRTGWPASMLGDLVVRTNEAVYTVRSHDGAWRMTADGMRKNDWPLEHRPFCMAASRDGTVLVHGVLVPDSRALDETSRRHLRVPKAIVVARDADSSDELWTAAPLADVPPPPLPPEPADEFTELAREFAIRSLKHVPFRAALSVAVSDDGSQTAWAEYGGWLRIKHQRGIGSWNPDHPVAFCPRQRGWLRVHGRSGEELARAEFPTDGLFQILFDPQGERLWCAPMSWFARGLAGRAWLPADGDARTVYLFDLRQKRWTASWRFPDAVSDLTIAPDGEALVASCWDGRIYFIGRDGSVLAEHSAGETARLAWSQDGRFSVTATEAGDVMSFDARGRLRWKLTLPADAPPPSAPLIPVFDDVPIYSVGRVGKEHAYVGDIWLVKAPEGGIFIDTAGSSAIPLTWQKIRAAGIDPGDVKYALLTHSHGDHAGAAYLWRTQGAKIVAPQSAALTVTWLMPTWSDYSIWAPSPIDQPLPLKQAGDEAQVTLAGLPVKAIFVPGHSFDSAIYVIEFGQKRVAFTGDIGFDGESHILHRCWGDREKAAAVARVVREQVLPLKPDHVLTGHGPRPQGTEFLEDLVRRTDAALE
jgi:glyoxylase-like metal-dependent hydrolase (beta-lactamase superfamily II)